MINRSEHIGDVGKRALLTKLQRIQRCLFFPGQRHWPPRGEWPDLAYQENQRSPFQAVLSSEQREAENWIVVPEELDADHPLLDVPTTRRIERTPEALAACAANLIRASRQIILVDPYFDPYTGRFRRVLRRLLQIASERNKEPDRLEYHLLQNPGRDPNRRLDRPSFCAGLRDIGIIPANLSVTFVRWRERQGGEQFHGRYILTERGALKFDAGLDAGEPGQTTPVNWEPPDEHMRLLSWFELDGQVFDRETPSVQVSSSGYLEDIE